METLEEINHYIHEHLKSMSYTEIVAIITMFYMVENKIKDDDTIDILMSYLAIGKLIKSFIHSDLTPDDIHPIKDVIMNKIRVMYNLYSEPVLLTRKPKHIDSYLQKTAKIFFMKISNNKTSWNPVDIIKLLSLNDKHSMACDHNIPRVCMILLLTNDYVISIENYLIYLI